MVAMSEDKILPSIFQKRNSKGALTIALTLFAVLAAIAVFRAKKFDTLLSFTIFLDCFGMVLSAGSIFILRKKTKHLDNTGIYKMKLYPLLTIIFMAAYTFVAISIAMDYKNNDNAALTGFCVMAGFMILYFIVKAVKPKVERNS